MITQAEALNENDITLVLEREFNASRERVFDAWTDPQMLRQWVGPHGIHAPEAMADARVDGQFRIPMIKQDTGENLTTAVGQYIEVNRPERLSFTWSWLQDDGTPGQLMVVTLDFVDINGRTALTLTHTNFIDEDVRAKHTSGWGGCFDCLEAFLAA